MKRESKKLNAVMFHCTVLHMFLSLIPHCQLLKTTYKFYFELLVMSVSLWSRCENFLVF